MKTAAIESGLVRITLAQALAGTGGQDIVQPLDTGAGETLTTQVRLDGVSAEVLAEALRRGTNLVGLEAWIAVRGGAKRYPAVAAVDLSRFAAAVAERAPDGRLACPAFAEALAEPQSLGVTLDRAIPAEARAEVTAALTDRLVARFGTLVPAPSGDDRTWMRLDVGQAVAGTLRLQLDDELLAPRYLHLDTSALIQAGGPQPAIRSHEMRAQESGWHRLVVGTNLSGQRVGILALVAELTAPPVPPARPAAARASVILDERGGPMPTALRLAPGEPLAFDVVVRATLPTAAGAVTLDGPVRHCAGPSVVLNPADLPVRIVPVAVDPALAAAADIKVTVATPDGVWRAEADVQADAGGLLIAVPTEGAPVSLFVAARARATGIEIRTPALPLETMRIDGFLFPEGGVQEARLRGRFGPGARADLLVECAPEDAMRETAGTLLWLRRDGPEAVFRWLPASPFAAGFRWRRPGTDWSPVMRPGAAIMVEAQEGAMADEQIIEGITFTSQDDEHVCWDFWPTGAKVARTEDGVQAALMEMGPITILAVTTVLGPDAAQLEKARAALATRAPRQVQLSPAPIEVGTVELMIGDGAGAFTPVATATSAGAPPWSAAFNAMLDGPKAEAAKKAFAGERGWLAVRYPIIVTGATHVASMLAVAEASASIHRTVGEKTEGAGATVVTGVAATVTTNTSARAASGVIESDAVDWGLPAR